MKAIKAFVAIGLVSASATMAAADLWNFNGLLASTNEPFLGQVHVPGAIVCWNQRPPLATNDPPYSSVCYSQTGGWWFGYGDNGGKIYDGVATSYDLTLNEALKINEYIDSEGQAFIKNKGMGNATEGLHVKFALGQGTADEPSLAGLGFNWRQKDGTDYENIKIENIGSKGTGLCIEYKSSKAGVEVELGWNEAAYGYNTWIFKLGACSGSEFCKQDMPWSAFEQSYEGTTSDRDFALANAEALKIAYKNKEPQAVDIEFKIRAIGWNGSCSGAASPIINGKFVAGPKFSVSNRVLSIANVSIPTQVQIINMQGAVVAQKTLGPNESLNLANMPTGVYMVRSAKLGISQKIILK